MINLDLFDAIIEATTIPNEAGRKDAITRLLNLIVDDAIESIDFGEAFCNDFAERVRDQKYTYRGVSR